MTARRLIQLVAAVVAIAILIFAPFQLKNYGIYLLSMWAIMTIAAIGLNLTLGYAGQISLAQGTFVGVGAYVAALMTGAGWPFGVAVIVAMLLCFVVGWLLGYPALRVQHHYLAFITLAFATLGFLLFRNEEWLTNGISGISGIKRPVVLGFATGRAINYYYFCLASLAVVGAGTWWLLRSPWGRAFLALRENPVRALSLGINTRRYTLIAFALGAALGGFAGALYAPLVQYIDPAPFTIQLSFNLLLMVIVGGSGYFFGPFLGALIAVLLPEWMRFAEGLYLIIYAAFVVVLMIFAPKGLLGLADRFLQPKQVDTRKPAAITEKVPS